MIAAYTNGTVTLSTNQTTNFTFDGNGDELTQTAVESSGNNQTTQYDFGTTGTIGTNLIDNDLLAETQFPNLSTGAAGTTSSTEQTVTYNRQGERISFTDQNGSTHSYGYDALARILSDNVGTLGSGVDGSVRKITYSFNDAGLVYQQTSFPASGGAVNQEQDAYNGLQQLITQYQAASGTVNTSTTPSVQYSYNLMVGGENNSKLRSTTYPDGRIVDTDYSSNQEPVTGIAVSGSTATVTTAIADGLSTGATVVIEGASHAALDGTFTITALTSTTFSYTFSGSASTDSSADITETPWGLDAAISRPDALQDHAGSAAGTVLQGYTYLGLGTIVQENDGNGTALSYIQQSPAPTPTPTTIDSGGDRYTGLDRFGRVVYQNWFVTSTGAQTQGDQYGYDQSGNVLYDSVVGLGSTAAGYSQLYHASSAAGGDDSSGYDQLGRLTTFIRGTLSASGNNTYSSAPLDTISNANINTVANSKMTYTLDALGNWNSSATGAGTGTSTAPTLASTSRTNNSQNELTLVGSASQSSDSNGNNTTGGNTYDAWDRLIRFFGGTVVYAYLPGDGRAVRTDCSSTVVDSYYSTDMQDLEDNTSSGGSFTTHDQYVWGLAYVNQMVERDDSSTSGSLGISGSGLGVRIYPQQDANFNVKTLTSNTGTVLEHIDFDPYGNAKLLTSAYATSATAFGSDTYNWIYGFQGGRYDVGTGLYHFGRGTITRCWGDGWSRIRRGTWTGPMYISLIVVAQLRWLTLRASQVRRRQLIPQPALRPILPRIRPSPPRRSSGTYFPRIRTYIRALSLNYRFSISHFQRCRSFRSPSNSARSYLILFQVF